MKKDLTLIYSINCRIKLSDGTEMRIFKDGMRRFIRNLIMSGDYTLDELIKMPPKKFIQACSGRDGLLVNSDCLFEYDIVPLVRNMKTLLKNWRDINPRLSKRYSDGFDFVVNYRLEPFERSELIIELNTSPVDVWTKNMWHTLENSLDINCLIYLLDILKVYSTSDTETIPQERIIAVADIIRKRYVLNSAKLMKYSEVFLSYYDHLVELYKKSNSRTIVRLINIIKNIDTHTYALYSGNLKNRKNLIAWSKIAPLEITNGVRHLSESSLSSIENNSSIMYRGFGFNHCNGRVLQLIDRL